MSPTETIAPVPFDINLRRLEGKKGLVGIANENSIAYGCARAFRSFGAELAITCLNDKAKPYVEPLAAALEAPIFMPLDVQVEGQLEAVFEEIKQRWGRLDIALHSIAYAPRADLHGRVVDCSREGFLLAMDVSCHSFIRMARLAEPLMTNGGARAGPSPGHHRGRRVRGRRPRNRRRQADHRRHRLHRRRLPHHGLT